MPRFALRTFSLLGLLLLAAIVLAPQAAAQTRDTLRSPAGFSNPSRTQPIESYRLPDWHYGFVTLDGSLLGNFSTVDRNGEQGPSLESSDARVLTNFRPEYFGLWESEQRQLRVSVDPRVGFRYSEQEDRDNRSPGTPSSSDLEQTILNLDLGASVLYDRYVSGDVFLRADEDFIYLYERVSIDNREEVDGVVAGSEGEVDVLDHFTSQTRLGIGVGRIRDVTPVVRALRVSERLRSVGEDGLSDADVQDAARQLARFPGYNSIYDRPDKYFWADFFDRIGGREGLSSLETFYVADVLQEPLGRRIEGAEVVVGPQLRLFHDEAREDVDVEPGAFLSARWAHNTNLRNQFSARLLSTIGFPSDDALNTSWIVRPSASWLWVLADRVQVNTTALARVNRGSLAKVNRDPADETRHLYRLESTLTVFLENALVLNGSVNLNHRRRNDDLTTTEWDVGFSVNVRYFLSRSLR